jgi:putative membrane protein
MDFLILIPYILLGTLMAGLVSLIPALHIFNLASFILLYLKFPQFLPGNALPAFMMSLVVSWSIINTIPALFLGAPDESAMFVVLPGQKYMMLGKGYEAAILSGVGALGAIIAIGVGSPVILRIFPKIRWLLVPHMFWILPLIVAYIVMSEWPKATLRPKTKWERFIDGWKSCSAGIATLILSGILGIFILNKPFIPIERAFQNIMPAFVGLYAVPWVITNIISKTEIPKQHICKSIDLDYKLAVRGTFAGVLGGSFAALMPIVTGGIGGLLAGHATAQRDDRLFIVSQGASKTMYYVGGFLLLFVPYFGAAHLRRGGMAWMLSPFYVPHSTVDYFMILGALAISAGFAFFLLLRFSRFMIRIITKFDYRLVSLVTVIILFAIVGIVTGLRGIFVTIIATGIGLIPVLFQSRRMNCMGILLIPLSLNMVGLGPAVLKFLHLV